MEKATDVMTEASVPFSPTIPDEAAYLVEAGRIPRFGNELRAGEHWIGVDIPQNWRARHQIARFVAVEERGQIEPEAGHTQLFYQVPKTVQYHTANNGMIGVERVPRAAVVGEPRAVLLEDIVGVVLQPAETQSGPAVVAFAGVIEDNVENDLDARPVQ